MPPKMKITAGPGMGFLATTWKNKAYSKIGIEEIQAAIENASTEIEQRQFKFETSMGMLADENLDWVIRQIDSCKELLDHNNALYVTMLTTIKFRPDVKANAEMTEDVATKLTVALDREKMVHKKWITSREGSERRRSAATLQRMPPPENIVDEEEEAEDADIIAIEDNLF
jgi:hypothetical protein